MPGFRVSTVENNDYSQVPVVQDFYLTYGWEVPRILGKDASNQINKNTLLMLKDATLPSFTVVKDSYIGGSLEYKYAKSVVWDDIRLTWYDTEGMLSVMKEWRVSVWTENGGLRAASDYKKDTKLLIYRPDGFGRCGYELNGSWPSQIKSGDLTYTSSEAKIIEVTVSYDWATEKLDGLFILDI